MIKRIAMPKSWPLSKKGKHKYVIKPRGSKENSIALLPVLRDLLGLVKTSREAKKILHAREVMVNNKVVGDRAFPIYPFDIIFLPKIKKYFRVIFKGKRFAAEEINPSEAKTKAYKVVGKKILKKGKVQLNLFQGANFIISSKEKETAAIKVNDSVRVDLQENKITKHLPLKEKAEIAVIGGKHMGEIGTITNIDAERDLIFIKTEKEEIKAPKEKILVVG